MRCLLSCVFAGTLVAAVLNAVVPPAGLGLAVMAWPTLEKGAMPQTVNRAHKTDRLKIPVVNGRRKVPPAAPAMLDGCEPVFSALASAARANYPGRCVA